MVIKVESYLGDAILVGKTYKIKKVREMVKNTLEDTKEIDFINVFCVRYGYEKYLLEENVNIECVIDLDTHIVYTPKYG